MLFDSHTHINNENYDETQRQALMEEIEASDVSFVMDVGFDLASSVQAIKDAKARSWCYAAVGVHPHDADSLDEETFVLLRGLAKKDKVQAIGEIGLDYYYDRSARDVQRYWFRRQIQMANELRMPIAIHSREADQETMDILREEGAFSAERQSWFPKRKGSEGELLPDSRVLLHCFSGSRELAQQYIRLGATLSICGPVTFKNNRKTREVVEAIPIDFLLVETDAPYLTPEPFRGRPNKAPYVEYTARKVAEIKGIAYEEAARITCENAKRFYNIP
jgi:TatD DNase family protein